MKIFPLGEKAITLSFGNIISEEINKKVLNLAGLIERGNFPGLIDVIPAYSSITIFYDPILISKEYETDTTIYDFVKKYLLKIIDESQEKGETEPRTMIIPASFSKENAPDLVELADYAGLSRKEVIEIFLSRKYRVFMLGFLPGFPYMGEIDERIAMPRRESPRLKVAKGSIGIAGKQTGIYPFDSPGGWQIIGKTKIELFRPDEAMPSYLRPGDLVEFREEK